MSTDLVRVTDPAAITDSASAVMSQNVFQRLMTAEPGQSVLKPDAARDCIFTSATTYSCTLNEGLTFHNGHALTSSDVKFSIQRATRLNVAGSSTSLLSSLRRIETPDPQTVRFLLSRPDTQFGWALASPAASIVDEEVYQQDDIRPPTEPVVGSGPFAVAHRDERSLLLTRHGTYVGRNPAEMQALEYRTAADSATIEDAMANGKVDVVWRGLNAAAITRYSRQAAASTDQLTTDGFTQHTYFGERVLQLGWNPASRMRGNRPLRQAIATALQGDRTLDSVVPPGIPGHLSSFPVGGKATPKISWKNRIPLTLSYDSTAPDGLDIATQIRTRLENSGGLSVQLRPDAVAADLWLLDRKAWTSTGLAWLQPYIDAPLPTAATTIQTIVTEFRKTTDDQAAAQLLGSLQKQAAVDNVLVPISQSDEYLYARAGVEVSETGFGPGWQLGLFGISNG
ncbi:MAG TPA: ABC transporter substrate-binding protein [Propionibacteriaceae bacterium]|nr:ABC transporter substrate-binding protein [Propionibacteriaceae bacterium]